jgi:hypothetical protein
MALTNPRRSPLAPLQKGGTGLLVLLLGVPYCRGTRTVSTSAFEGGFSGGFILGFPQNKKPTRQGDL